jgi:hypothetical protein
MIFPSSEAIELNDEGVRFYGILALQTVPFDKIVRVRCVSFWRAMLETFQPGRPLMHWRQSSTGRVVVLETKHARFALHPANPERFVRQVCDRMPKGDSSPQS